LEAADPDVPAGARMVGKEGGTWADIVAVNRDGYGELAAGILHAVADRRRSG